MSLICLSSPPLPSPSLRSPPLPSPPPLSPGGGEGGKWGSRESEQEKHRCERQVGGFPHRMRPERGQDEPATQACALGRNRTQARARADALSTEQHRPGLTCSWWNTETISSGWWHGRCSVFCRCSACLHPGGGSWVLGASGLWGHGGSSRAGTYQLSLRLELCFLLYFFDLLLDGEKRPLRSTSVETSSPPGFQSRSSCLSRCPVSSRGLRLPLQSRRACSPRAGDGFSRSARLCAPLTRAPCSLPPLGTLGSHPERGPSRRKMGLGREAHDSLAFSYPDVLGGGAGGWAGNEVLVRPQGGCCW